MRAKPPHRRVFMQQRRDLALAPALDDQVQDAFIATHPRDGGFVALLAAARGGPPSRGAALLHESSRARTMPTDRILTCRFDMTRVGRGRSSD